MKVKEAVATYKTHRKTYTYQDYLDLPEDRNRYEIIEGELIVSPAPFTIHQDVSLNIVAEMLKFNEKKKIGKIYYAPTDVILSENTVVQPDILFIAKENYRIITEKNIKGVPDLIIEIVSPSTAYYDMISKKEIYENYGVKDFWIVDPKKQWVEIFLNIGNRFELNQRLKARGELTSNVLNGFQLKLEKIFRFE